MPFRAKDFMSKKIKAVLPDTNVRDAIKILIDSDVSGLPVIDSEGNLLGVFTEREILKAILPVYVKSVGTFIYGEESKSAIKKTAALDNFLVKDLMRKEVTTLDEESALSEVSKTMLIKSERRIIMMREKKPVGVITRADVIKAFVEAAGIL
ncbi:MAG: hypothetical protein A2987_01905 [Omnitrophica bacterium RIFCSPLOWO2_01_FULL_45_10]|nr:MAG: hypothetical protein A2987_01905 [Omnitrophica bacterium RIFCSPLOWO2_01_FULL_45_10]